MKISAWFRLPAAPVLDFARRVFRDFRKNQGFLLASGVAYNTLLSIVPLFAVLLVLAAHVADERSLLATVAVYVELLLPGRSAAVMDQVRALLAHREVIAGVGGLALFFFSSIAFTVLEGAMQVIFFHRLTDRRRHFLWSAALPYLFIMALGVGLLLVSIISGALQAVGRNTIPLFGRPWSLAGLSRAGLWLLGTLETRETLLHDRERRAQQPRELSRIALPEQLQGAR